MLNELLSSNLRDIIADTFLTAFGGSQIKTNSFRGSLRNKLLLTLILISVLPSSFIGLISFKISSKVLNDIAIETSTELIDRIGDELENLFFEAYKLSVIITNNLKIQSVLRKDFTDNSERYAIDLEASTELYFIKDYMKEIFGLYVIGENGGRYRSNFYTFKEVNFQTKRWYQNIIKSESPVWTGPNKGSKVVVTTGDKVFELGIPVIDKASGNKMGIVLSEISEKKVGSIIDARLGKTGFIVALNEKNEIVSGKENAQNLNELELSSFQRISAASYDELDTVIRGVDTFSNDSVVDVISELPLVIVKTFPINGWKVVGFIPREELTKNSKRVGIIVTLLILLLAIISVLMSFYFSGQIIKPIRTLIGLMGQVEDGDLDVNMKLTRDDEIGRLGNSFNMMIRRINTLMEQVHDDHKKLEKAKYKTLQAQINPHFLYNTLDSVIWLARAESYNSIVTMTTALTKFFRIGLSRGKDLIEIQDEFDHVENYLIIQSLRYENKFTYSIEYDENIAQLKIIKIVLQPLVENAIYHGVKLKRDSGEIKITGKKVGDEVWIEVSDTGAGMSPEQLKALSNTLNKTGSDKLDSYGVVNVNERIKIFFGDKYGLSYKSIAEEGTVVTMKIPAVTDYE